MVTSGGLWWYLELLFLLFHPCKNSFLVYEGKTEEGIITGNNCIHTLLLFLFSPLWDETLCNFTSRQVFLDNSWSRSLAWPKNSRIPDSQISVSGKVS